MTARVALITGATSGIGWAIAQRLAGAGFDIALHGRRPVSQGTALAAKLPSARYHVADLADNQAIAALVRDVLCVHGRLDVLINNAAITRIVGHAELAAASPQLWRDLYEINVIAPWTLITEAETALRAAADNGQASVVINISSHAGVRPKGASIPYAASKAALNHMTQLLAKTLAPAIRVNAIAPGLVATPMSADWHEIRSHWRHTAPMQREAQPDDIADIAWSLITNHYLTGEILLADGGMNLM